MKKSLIGLSALEIADLVKLKERYRSNQIFDYLLRGSTSFGEMRNIPLRLRDTLDSSFLVYSSNIIKEESSGNSSKIAIKLNDSLVIEAVLLTDEKNRKTACLSSQVGCAMGCKFCRTGKMGLERNLGFQEIVEQFFHLRRIYGTISNIVFMGMGEPLMNLDEVLKAIHFFTSSNGLGMSPRRITISTCGIVGGISRLKEEAPKIRLAVSLVTASNGERLKIMPVTIKNNLDDLKKVLLDYQKESGKRITLECALLKGINDSPLAASKIVSWASGLGVNINIIPWNPVAGMDFEEPSEKAINSFCRVLENKNIPYTRRYRRGRDLNAACGQLATKLDE